MTLPGAGCGRTWLMARRPSVRHNRWRGSSKQRSTGEPTSTEAALLGAVFPCEHGLLDLVRKNGEMAGDPVEHYSLVFVSCQIANLRCLRSVLPQLFNLS